MLAQPYSPFPAGMPPTSAAGKRVRWADGESIRRCMTPGPEVARPPTTRRPSYSKPHPYKIWVPDASQFPDSEAKPSPVRSTSRATPTTPKAPTMPAGVAYAPPKVPLHRPSLHASLAASIARPSTAPLPPAHARTPLMANNVNAAEPVASPKARSRRQHEFWYPGAHTVQPEHSTDCRKCWLTRLNAYQEGGVMDGTLTCSRHS